MKSKIFYILFFIFAFSSISFSQNAVPENIILHGTVLDKSSNIPLSYVNVGIVNKSFGTVTDTNGNFSFKISKENLSDTMQISIIGYATEKILVKDFLSNESKTIKLALNVEQLADVIVSIPRTKTEIIGRQSVSKIVQVSVHNKKSAEETIGSEMGMRYYTKEKNAILKDLNFYISLNNFNWIKFRVNVYSVKNDYPDTLIVRNQIFATLDDFKTGWNKIDLEDYQIGVNGSFIVTIQWVDSRMDKTENPLTILPVALTPFSKNCYIRIASQDKWKRAAVNLSSYVTVLY